MQFIILKCNHVINEKEKRLTGFEPAASTTVGGAGALSTTLTAETIQIALLKIAILTQGRFGQISTAKSVSPHRS
jgi:hypothetical protein